MDLIFFVGVFVLIVIGKIYQHHSRYGRFPTFEAYQNQHPGLVKRGRTECYKCGGTKIYVRGLWSATDAKKTHFCSTCGTPLYKSKH